MGSPLPPTLHTLTADDGVALSYATWEPAAGNGSDAAAPSQHPPPPSILLLHGWSGSRHYWDPVVPVLLAAGCRVIAPDLRWHGASGRPPAGHGLARLADDLAGLVAALGRPASGLTAVGSSMGAAVLWAHAARHGCAGLGRHVYVDQVRDEE